MYAGKAALKGKAADILQYDILDGTTVIADEAFLNCSNLEFLLIPNSVKLIGDNIVNGCGKLTSIVIPSSVTDIGEKAFANCPNLEVINCEFAENAVSGAPWGTAAQINYFS